MTPPGSDDVQIGFVGGGDGATGAGARGPAHRLAVDGRTHRARATRAPRP